VGRISQGSASQGKISQAMRRATTGEDSSGHEKGNDRTRPTAMARDRNNRRVTIMRGNNNKKTVTSREVQRQPNTNDRKEHQQDKGNKQQAMHLSPAPHRPMDTRA
jgi:hypothetical protein